VGSNEHARIAIGTIQETNSERIEKAYNHLIYGQGELSP